MEDLLDLDEERRRGPATSVRTDSGRGSGPRISGWGGATPPALASLSRLGPTCPWRQKPAGSEPLGGEADEEAASLAPPLGQRGALLLA